MQTRSNDVAAFPRTGAGNAGVAYDVPAQDGMTLRDYMAAKALPVVAESFPQSEHETAKNWAAWVSKNAYAMADAMLAERAK